MIDRLNEQELELENALIDDLERLLDKHMVSQEQIPDGWVIDTANVILLATRSASNVI